MGYILWFIGGGLCGFMAAAILQASKDGDK